MAQNLVLSNIILPLHEGAKTGQPSQDRDKYKEGPNAAEGDSEGRGGARGARFKSQGVGGGLVSPQ